ncbi:hypothetical protein N7467_006519 [Penicillium canescens]|nr:hypothetical protein N7467_006519 [Penicillium canescens]
MVLEYYRVLQTGMVQFVVGKDRKRFLIHAELVSSIPSEILRPPIVEDIDEVLFGRCYEFAYSSDYSVPSPIYDDIGNHSSTESFPIVYAELRERLGQVNPKYRANDEPTTDPKYSYADIFLCHAGIYHFPSRTGWTALYYLSFYRLLQLLANFALCEERTRDIVTLFKFAFEDIDSKEFEGIGDIKFEGMGKIKNLVGDYALWNLEILMRDVDFQLVLDKRPSLEKGLFRWMWK